MIPLVSTRSTQNIMAIFLACKQNKGVADKGPLSYGCLVINPNTFRKRELFELTFKSE